MADVIPFRRARLTGFIPDTEVVPPEFIGSDNHQGERSLIEHARTGRPSINLAEPFTGDVEYPSDTEPQGAA